MVTVILVLLIIIQLATFVYLNIIASYSFSKEMKKHGTDLGNRIWLTDNPFVKFKFGGGLLLFNGDIFISKELKNETFVFEHELGHRKSNYNLRSTTSRLSTIITYLIVLISWGVWSYFIISSVLEIMYLIHIKMSLEAEADSYVTDKRKLAEYLTGYSVFLKGIHAIPLNYRINKLVSDSLVKEEESN